MKEVISSKRAPEAVGSYSQAVKANGFMFLSGQICLNPETGEFERDSVASQTHRIMENIKAVVEDAGANMNDVVKCNVHLSGMDKFAEMDAVYKQYFDQGFPARITTGGSEIYDKLDVEIDVVVSVD
jgi:2-iminobutanoate/2-iminopropanoate deaminase